MSDLSKMTELESGKRDGEPLPSRYVVGIDLGTTNSAAAYVDTAQADWDVQVFPVLQVVAPGQLEPHEILPSFHYQPPEAEIAAGALQLPWQREHRNYAVGRYARDFGAQLAGRQVASAKSWLCHPGVDRRGDILPWHAAEDVDRLSPVEASARYLRQIREAWDAAHPQELLANQDVVLTLPASFDEVARELTIEAAARAGLPRVVLIEEPQAAFYAWIHKHAESWDQRVEAGQKILVCDIGGGTSDFTLLRVRRLPAESGEYRSEQDRVQFHRVAVGEHLVLGGDNLDLTLAKHLETRLGGGLSPRHWDLLLRSCRRIKEQLLGAEPPEQVTLHLPATGSKLIGGGMQLELTRSEVHSLLLDGFFPATPLDSRPIARQSGFQEFGLPYAADPAITRHLAAFLTAHRQVAIEDVPSTAQHDPARPDIVLFNGGVFESPVIRQRLIDTLSHWFSSDGQRWTPIVLENDRLDLAVARGAAYYGMVRRGAGVRIAASLARSYYLGFEQAATTGSSSPSGSESLLCIVPGNAEPGSDITIANCQFELQLSQPVEFPLYVSSVRLTDAPGERIAFDPDQIKPLPPIRTALRTRRRHELDRVVVRIHARLSEIGTLELFCREVGSDREWRLDFDIRSATQTDLTAHETTAEQQGIWDESVWDDVRGVLVGVFGDPPSCAADGLMKDLTAACGLAREEWPPTLLRRIWAALIDVADGRRRSAVHEARWLNLLGYALRPGYGMAVDDWRVAETWRLLQGKLVHPSPNCRTESLILWRRIAGGLSAGQQRAIAEPLLGSVRALHRRFHGGKDRGETIFSPHEANEVWRLLGSLELLSVGIKNELGKMLVDLLPKRKLEASRAAMLWTLGRLGARAPIYGPLNTIVPTEVVARWIESLLEFPPDPQMPFTLLLLARRTDDRYRDLPDSLRARVLDWLRGFPETPAHFLELIERAGHLDAEEQGRAFGDSLPRGLRLL